MSDNDIKVLVEDLKEQRNSLEKKEEYLKKHEEDLVEKLSKVSKMTVEEAKKELLEQVQKSLTSEVAKKIRLSEEKIKLEAGEKAREILADAMKHAATSYVAEYTVSSITVPNEDVKGRIIGAGGRNIRAFERAAKVEIELDEGNEIRISSFDAIRREIAKRALEILIKDTRIQPSIFI
jgi:ribonuclease Y